MKTRKTDIVTIRVTEEEKKLLKEKARRKRKTLSAYIISKTIEKKYNIQYTDIDGNYKWWLTDVNASNEEDAIKQAEFELKNIKGLSILKYEIDY